MAPPNENPLIASDGGAAESDARARGKSVFFCSCLQTKQTLPRMGGTSELLALLGLALLLQAGVTAGRDQGVVTLDAITFAKIVGGERPALVRFDVLYPFGDETEAYQLVALNSTSSSLVVCHVGISDYDDAATLDLAKRFGVPTDDRDTWPVIIFFPARSLEGVTYVGDKQNADELRRFIRGQGVYIGLEGCTDAGDKVAKDFMVSDARTRKALLAETDKAAAADGIEGTLKLYVAVMKKIMEKGDGFISTETTRLKRVIAQGIESLTSAQVRKLKMRLNVVASFTAE